MSEVATVEPGLCDDPCPDPSETSCPEGETCAEISTHQPTLDDAIFPAVRARDVPTVKVTISGTVEMTQEEYQAYLDGATLGPGAVVEIGAVGYVLAPSAAWVQRGGRGEKWWEREGRIKVKLALLGTMTATGEVWDGE